MIGIFDSGSGGLTVLKALRDELPSSDVIYFGDIKNAPYGEKSREELSVLTVEAIKFLQEHGAQSIINACNSVSTSLALSVLDIFDLANDAIVEMVGPTVSFFKRVDSHAVLCATPATIKSGIYQNAFRMIGKEIDVIEIPELAGAIEFGKSHEEIENIIRQACAHHVFGEGDVLIFGCTHYPLVADIFRSVLPPSVKLYDPAEAVAQRAKKRFWPREVGNGTTSFFISKDSDLFRQRLEILFPKMKYSITVVQ